MPTAPERVLFLADGAETGVLRAAVSPLASVPEFAPFARRIRALSEALTRGGADETYATADLGIRDRDYDRERVVDLSQSGDSCYSGDLIEFSVESGRRVVYRKKGEVLVFAASDVRPFRKKGAASVQPGDAILVLHKRIRDRLAEELTRSKGTTGLLKQYHDKIAACRRGIPGRKLRDKALHVLQLMREVHPEIGEHEVPNIMRWLDVGRPGTDETQPRAARDHRRFRLFTDALEIDSTVADAFWNVAIVPQRTYSIRESYQFNRRVVQFILDPEGVAPGAAYSGALWQRIVDSVETVTGKEIRRA